MKPIYGQAPASERLRRARAAAKMEVEARSERLQTYLEAGGDPDVVCPELIPTVEDQVALEKAIKALGAVAARQPRGRRRARKVQQMLPLVAELVVVERVLAMDAPARARLRPSDLATLAHVDRRELMAQVTELVAGTVGGGLAPKIEIAR